jgi:hypothetical protein
MQNRSLHAAGTGMSLCETSVYAGQGCLLSPLPRSATSPLISHLDDYPTDKDGILAGRWPCCPQRKLVLPARMAIGCSLMGWSCRDPAGGDLLRETLLAAVTSSSWFFLMTATTPSRCCIPNLLLPVSSLSPPLLPFHFTMLNESVSGANHA